MLFVIFGHRVTKYVIGRVFTSEICLQSLDVVCKLPLKHDIHKFCLRKEVEGLNEIGGGNENILSLRKKT